MPTKLHEALIEMFRARPALTSELLRGPLGAGVPPHEHVQVVSGDLTTLVPTELRADLVVTFTGGTDDARQSPALTVVVEVQLQRDDDKKKSWPAYVANLHARYSGPVVLLVVCPSRATAAWAGEPIVLGPGSVLTPLVIGPDVVPVITDAGRARLEPEIAVLSALTHGRSPGHRNVLDAAISALNSFDAEQAVLYAETMLVALPTGARRYLEAQMTTDFDYQPKTEFFRRVFDQYSEVGRAEGRAEGEAKGEAKAVLSFLDARGLDVPDSIRTRILECNDLDQLELWVRRAATVSSAEELFE